MSKYYLGIMCGTSLDSIDISIACCTNTRIKAVGFKSYSLEDKLKKRINRQKTSKTSKKSLIELNHDISIKIVSHIKNILKEFGFKKESIQAIGFPGITLNHRPDAGQSTYMGDPEIISSKTSIPVVADFRQTDINAGGQGAPLTGLFHNYLNSFKKEFITFVNLGGFANITVKKGEKIIAYDTGPSNYLIDLWCRKKFNREFDLDGRLAAMGDVDVNLLKSLLKDKFFKKPAPKSTGFEYFNHPWLKKHLSKSQGINKLNVLSTLTYFTAITVSDELNRYKTKSNLIYFSGGGAFNNILVKGILDLTGKKRLKSLVKGVNEKNLESMAFAWLASMRMSNKKFTKSSITGAKKSYLLGAIY